MTWSGSSARDARQRYGGATVGTIGRNNETATGFDVPSDRRACGRASGSGDHDRVDDAYKVKVAGSQTVQWHFDGDVRLGACGDGTPITQTGAGKGSLTFHFATAKPGLAVASPFGSFSFAFDTKSEATGTMVGSLAYNNGRPCAGSSPIADETEPATACGAQTFRLAVQGQWKSGFLRMTGAEDTLFAATPRSGASFNCPFPLTGVQGLAIQQSGTSCETKNGAQVWQRTNELSSFGRGLANIKIAITPKALLHFKTRVTTLARRVVKRCRINLSNSAAQLVVDVTTRVSVTLKR